MPTKSAADSLKELLRYRKARQLRIWERLGRSRNPLPPWPAWVRNALATESPSAKELDWLEQKLRERATEEAVPSHRAATFETNAVGDRADSNFEQRRNPHLRSTYKKAIREALISLGNDASAQQVANWIAENCPNSFSEFAHLAKYGSRRDMGQLYRTEKKFRGQFDRDVTDIRKMLK